MMHKKDRLKIATYNIQHFQNEKQVIHALQTLVVDEQIDILCLQEFIHTEGEEKAKRLIKTILPGWEAVFYHDSLFPNHGFAIIWTKEKKSLTFLRVDKILLPVLNRPFGKLEKIYMRPKKELGRRAAIIGYFTFHGEKLRIANLHLDPIGSEKHRTMQLRFLHDYLQKEKATYEIICGDFNTLGVRFFTKKQQKTLHTLLERGYTNTCSSIRWTQDGLASIDMAIPSKKFRLALHLMKKLRLHVYQKLDYIFVKGFSSAQAKRFDIAGSDHFPIVATLQF